MKILIIAYYYPPETYAMMASLRPHSWAKYWSQAGHEIRVLTTLKKRTDEELNPWPNTGIEEVPYFYFKTPLTHKKTSSANQTTFNQGLKNYVRQGLLFLQKRLGAGTLLYGSNLWILPAYHHAVKLYQHWPFDCIVSTFSPPAAHVIAYLLKRQYHQLWVADYRDLWCGNHFTETNYFCSFLEKFLENSCVCKANFLTTVSYPLKKNLESRFDCPSIIIENGFDVKKTLTRSLETKKKKITLAYTGSFYPEKQVLTGLLIGLNSLEACSKNKIEILFYSLQSNIIEKLSQDYSVSQIVKAHSFIARDKCLKLQAEVDLLIFLDWNDPSIEGILTGKIFEYMASGTPVINIGCDHETDASRLITEAGIGVNLGNDPQAIAAYLKRLLQGEKPYYQPNQAVIEKYSRKKLAEKMLEEILHYKNQWDSNQT